MNRNVLLAVALLLVAVAAATIHTQVNGDGGGGGFPPPSKPPEVADVECEVEGVWRHDPFLAWDTAWITGFTYRAGNWRVKPILPPPPLSLWDTGNMKLEVKVYDSGGRLVYSLAGNRAVVFHVDPGDWKTGFTLIGLEEGVYTVNLTLYQWVLGTLPGTGRWVYRDTATYTMEVNR